MTRTPYRVSFFGGGSDYPEWYLKHGGCVLSTSIDKYVYISVRHIPKILQTTHRVVWRYVENVESLDDILHPAVREGLRMLDFDDEIGLEITYQGDLPARSGIGSSSTFAVGLLNALYGLQGKTRSAIDCTFDAIRLEREILKDNVGSQDQTAAAFGGLNFIQFNTDGSIDVKPVQMERQHIDDLNSHLLLFFTGKQRTSSNVAKSVIENLEKKADQIRQLQSMAKDGIAVLEKGQWQEFGRMLDEAWSVKRGLAQDVATNLVDRVYNQAKDEGAWGGKLLGAGNGGFMLFIAPPDSHQSIKQTLNDYGIFVDVALGKSGSQIVFNSGT